MRKRSAVNGFAQVPARRLWRFGARTVSKWLLLQVWRSVTPVGGPNHVVRASFWPWVRAVTAHEILSGVASLLAHTSGLPNPFPLRWVHRPQDHAAFDESAVRDRICSGSALTLRTSGFHSELRIHVERNTDSIVIANASEIDVKRL